MGNRSGKPKKSKVDIVPYDEFKKHSQIVTLFGPANSAITSYIRFALLYKPVSLRFVPTEASPNGYEAPTLQIGPETITGSRETLIHYIENKFPHPRLMLNRVECNETMPLVVMLVRLQHRSVIWHMERVVRWVDDLMARGGRRGGDPMVGNSRMEVRRFEKSYSQLLEVMLEHAQMEERVVFPILEIADRGLSKAANEEHARDLPKMNGIKEDIKSICVMDAGSPAHLEALLSLSTRLKSLLEHCKHHFDEEERDLMPLMDAAMADMSKEKQDQVLEQCLDVMEVTHSQLSHFFIEGLLPHEAMRYLDLITRWPNTKRLASMLRKVFDSENNEAALI